MEAQGASPPVAQSQPVLPLLVFLTGLLDNRVICEISTTASVDADLCPVGSNTQIQFLGIVVCFESFCDTQDCIRWRLQVAIDTITPG